MEIPFDQFEPLRSIHNFAGNLPGMQVPGTAGPHGAAGRECEGGPCAATAARRFVVPNHSLCLPASQTELSDSRHG